MNQAPVKKLCLWHRQSLVVIFRYYGHWTRQQITFTRKKNRNKLSFLMYIGWWHLWWTKSMQYLNESFRKKKPKWLRTKTERNQIQYCTSTCTYTQKTNIMTVSLSARHTCRKKWRTGAKCCTVQNPRQVLHIQYANEIFTNEYISRKLLVRYAKINCWNFILTIRRVHINQILCPGLCLH